MRCGLLAVAVCGCVALGQPQGEPAAEEAPLLSDAALEFLSSGLLKGLDEWSEGLMERCREERADAPVPESYEEPEGFDPVGDWHTGGGLSSAQLHLRRTEDGSYRVLFRTSGCLGGWALWREAEYEAGVLTLDEPVVQYLPIAYDRLFAIRSEEGDHLVPGEGDRYPGGLPAGGTCRGVTRDMEFFGMTRYDADRVASIERTARARGHGLRELPDRADDR